MTSDQATELYKLGVFKYSLVKQYLSRTEYRNLLSFLQLKEIPDTYVKHFPMFDYKDEKGRLVKELHTSTGEIKVIKSTNIKRQIDLFLKKNNLVSYNQHLIETVMEPIQSNYTLNY